MLFAATPHCRNPERVASVLRIAVARLGFLDSRTIRCLTRGNALLASVHRSPTAAATTIRDDADTVAWIDGTLIDPDRQALHGDADPCPPWDDRVERCEGRFVVGHLERDAIRAVIDPLGFYQLYATEPAGDEGPWIGNHVGLLCALIGARNLDPLGVASFVATGWAWGDRTLHRGVITLGGGVLWHASRRGVAPAKSAHFGPHMLSSRDRDGDTTAAETATALADVLRPLTTHEQVHLPLTGGRDSRVILALLTANGHRVPTFTRGQADDEDVLIARELAAVAGVPHEHRAIEAKDALHRWSDWIDALVAVSDGLVSAWQLADMSDAESTAPPRLYLGGIGGEVARRFYLRKRPERWDDAEWVERELRKALLGPIDDLLTPAARTMLQDALAHTLRGLRDAGIEAPDLPDAYYAFERVRRWGGSNARKVSAVGDTVPILASRPFLTAAFRMPPSHRHDERLHRDLMAGMAPELEAIPYTGQRPSVLPLWRWLAPWRHRTLLERILLHRRRRIRDDLASLSPAIGELVDVDPLIVALASSRSLERWLRGPRSRRMQSIFHLLTLTRVQS